MIATALTGTASPIDTVLLDELEGAANVELYYDGGLAAARMRPAIDPVASHSRDAEHLHPEPERAARRALLDTLPGDPRARHAALLQRIDDAPDNASLLGLRPLDRKAAAGE